MVLIGLLLPMTEALQHSWNMTIYNMASYHRRPSVLLHSLLEVLKNI